MTRRDFEMQALGHNPINACRSTMIQAFLDDPSAPVDASCRNEVPREPWVIEPIEPPEPRGRAQHEHG